MAEFAVSYDTVIKRREGGWVNHPQDPGSETYKGITKQFDPLWPGWQRVDLQRGHVGFPGSLERDPILQAMVRDFYHYGVWMKIRGDELGPQALADEMLDNATLQGPGAAIVFLQFALNAMNRGGSLYPDVTVDGGFGGKTLGALHSLMLREAPERLVKTLNVLQGAYLLLGKELIQFLKAHPTPAWREAFMRGWIDRVSLA